MVKKTTKKAPAKKIAKKEKVTKVVIEEPIIELAPETHKEEPVAEKLAKEAKPLPAEPEKKPVINPNDPKEERTRDGFKRPSITDVELVHTKKQFDKLVEGYKKQCEEKMKINPHLRNKYEAKVSEFAKKRRELQ